MLVKNPKTITQAIVLFLKLLHVKLHVYHEISNYECWWWHKVDNNLSTEAALIHNIYVNRKIFRETMLG